MHISELQAPDLFWHWTCVYPRTYFGGLSKALRDHSLASMNLLPRLTFQKPSAYIPRFLSADVAPDPLPTLSLSPGTSCWPHLQLGSVPPLLDSSCLSSGNRLSAQCHPFLTTLTAGRNLRPKMNIIYRNITTEIIGTVTKHEVKQAIAS